MTDRRRLGDQEAGEAILAALCRQHPGYGLLRDSPMWIEVAWALSEAGYILSEKGPDDL